MKACPFCAEQIQDAAIKCRWCGEMLEPENRTGPASEALTPDATGTASGVIAGGSVPGQPLPEEQNVADLLPMRLDMPAPPSRPGLSNSELFYGIGSMVGALLIGGAIIAIGLASGKGVAVGIIVGGLLLVLSVYVICANSNTADRKHENRMRDFNKKHEPLREAQTQKAKAALLPLARWEKNMRGVSKTNTSTSVNLQWQWDSDIGLPVPAGASTSTKATAATEFTTTIIAWFSYNGKIAHIECPIDRVSWEGSDSKHIRFPKASYGPDGKLVLGDSIVILSPEFSVPGAAAKA